MRRHKNDNQRQELQHHRHHIRHHQIGVGAVDTRLWSVLVQTRVHGEIAHDDGHPKQDVDVIPQSIEEPVFSPNPAITTWTRALFPVSIALRRFLRYPAWRRRSVRSEDWSIAIGGLDVDDTRFVPTEQSVRIERG